MNLKEVIDKLGRNRIWGHGEGFTYRELDEMIECLEREYSTEKQWLWVNLDKTKIELDELKEKVRKLKYNINWKDEEKRIRDPSHTFTKKRLNKWMEELGL